MKGLINLKSYFLLLLLLALIHGCSSNSTSNNDDDDQSNDELFSIAFSKNSAAPFEAIEFTGLPESSDELNLYAAYRANDNADSYQTLIYQDQDGWFIRIPIHPNSPLEGGRVQISIQGLDGTESNWESFEITALPKTENAFRTLSQGLSKLLTEYLKIIGLTREELAEMEIAELNEIQTPLYLAYSVIDMPENENNLAKIAAGTAPVLINENINLDLLDAVTASLRIQDLVDIALNSVDSLSLNKNPNADIAKINDLTPKSGSVNNTLTIDAKTLSDLMWAQHTADVLNSKRGQEIMNTAGQGLAILSILLPPPQKAIGAAASAAMYGYTTIIDAVENTYPSQFLSSENDFQINPTIFPEDSDGGSWSLNVVATSNGWAVDKAILNGLLQLVGLKGAKNINHPILDAAKREYSEEVVDALVGEFLNQIVNLSTFGNSTEGLLRIEPKQWSSDVTELSKISVVEGDAVKVDPVRYNGISTNKVGIARVRGEKKEGYFAYQAILRFQNVEVKAIDVSIQPDLVYVDPGDPMFFDSTVEWANDESVKWSVTDGEILGANDQKTMVLKTPDEEWDDPIEVRATSQSKGGLRAKNEAIPRFGLAAVYANKIRIEIIPGWACVEKSKTKTFQAKVEGVEGDPDISWSASSGSFSGSTYFAPGSNVGNVTITATVSTEDREVSESITIRVGECKCYWSADFSGGLSISSEGEYAVFEDIFVQGESGTQFTFWPSTSDNRPAIFSTSLPRISNSFTGSVESLVIVNVDNSANSDWVSLEDSEFGTVLPRNNITANSGEVRVGIISGQLVQFDLNVTPPTIDFAGFTVRYVARRKTGGGNPCN